MPTIGEVKAYLAARSIEVTEFDEPTPTCETAARAVGCSVGEIAKTVLFFVGQAPAVVVAAGDVRVRGSALKRALGLSGKVRLPAPHEVEEATGYAAGGVCPFLLPPAVAVVVDSSLRRFPVVYTAAGNDHSVVPVTADQLLALTNGREADVCGEAGA